MNGADRVRDKGLEGGWLFLSAPEWPVRGSSSMPVWGGGLSQRNRVPVKGEWHQVEWAGSGFAGGWQPGLLPPVGENGEESETQPQWIKDTKEVLLVFFLFFLFFCSFLICLSIILSGGRDPSSFGWRDLGYVSSLSTLILPLSWVTLHLCLKTILETVGTVYVKRRRSKCMLISSEIPFSCYPYQNQLSSCSHPAILGLCLRSWSSLCVESVVLLVPHQTLLLPKTGRLWWTRLLYNFLHRFNCVL